MPRIPGLRRLFGRHGRDARPALDPAQRAAIAASPLFDAAWYVARYPDVAGFAPGPLAHFCRHGLHERRDPGPNFDTGRYLAAVPEAGLGPAPPFLVALASDAAAASPRPPWLPDDPDSLAYLLRASGLFDAAWYRAAYPDVVAARLDPLHHYLAFGVAEPRDPGPGFDAAHYAETYPAYREACRTAIEHYLRIGRYRGLRPTGRTQYARWLAAHDRTTPADLAAIGADAERTPPPPVLCIQVIDPFAVVRLDALSEAWAAQCGVVGSARLLRGEGVSDAAWAGCEAHVAGTPGMRCVAARDALRDIADGTVVLLCAGPAVLRPHTAYAFARALHRAGAEGGYSDHDGIDAAGERATPVFTPAMSPTLMRVVPYAGAVVAVILGPRTRASVAAALADLRDPERAFADLLLALDPERVVRIPLILHHRVGRGEPAAPLGHIPAPRLPPAEPEAWPQVRIVIPTRDRGAVLRACIDSIRARTDYPADRYAITIVDNDSREPETLAFLAAIVADPRIAVVSSPGPFNFAKICNDGAAATEAEILVFLNNDTTVHRADWLARLAGTALRPEVGAVGAQLLYPDGTVQHGGVILGFDGVGAHRLVGLSAEEAAAVDATREMTAVTGACLALRRAAFAAVGGFDPVLAVDYNDVALCAALIAAGYRNIYLAEPLLIHHESLSRGHTTGRAAALRNAQEGLDVRTRFPRLIRDDPSYSPNLSLRRMGALAEPPRVIAPWRRRGRVPGRVLILSDRHAAGHGIAAAVSAQARALRGAGWEVVVGGPVRDDATGARAAAYPGCERVDLRDARAAALFATERGVDCILVHTPPFHAVTPVLGNRPLVYLVDHGHPPPHLFPDRAAREDALLDWRACGALAARVFATSEIVRERGFREDAIVLGNPHDLEQWSEGWAARRAALRAAFGFGDRFVVLCTGAFAADERFHDGRDVFVNVATAYRYRRAGREAPVLFVLATQGAEDPDEAEGAGVRIVAGLDAAALTELCAASDLYLALPLWEGTDPGIARALAMGLPVVASDLPGHRGLPVETVDGIPAACRAVARYAGRSAEAVGARSARIVPPEGSLDRLSATMAEDLAAEDARSWI